MTQRASAIIRFEFPWEKEAKITLEALKPEVKSSPRHRSKVQLTQQGRELRLTFEAKDTIALRASINSYLRWLHLLHDLYETLESSSQ
ncbi:MAG: KEOPS complex subunit Pcc1 [Candidatus Bathyarchaeia archaeon]